MTNGEVICNANPITVGEECNVNCNEGYTPDQNTVRCQDGGILSPTPMCKGTTLIFFQTPYNDLP